MKLIINNLKIVLVMKISEFKNLLLWLKYIITFLLGFFTDKVI